MAIIIKVGLTLESGEKESSRRGVFVGRFETVPYNHSTMRSTYHTRKYDITRLMRVS